MTLWVNTKADLNDLALQKSESLIFRTKCSWYEFEGKSSKYFYALKKAKYNAKTCKAIFNEKNVFVEDDPSILKTQEAFYTKLYDKDPNVQF